MISSVLVTGGEGYLGKIICNSLKVNNAVRVESLGRGTSNNIVTDLANDDCFFERQFDLIVHAAGKAHQVPKNEAEAKQFFDVNVNGTRNLLKGIALSGLPRYFVYISSVAVYGRQAGQLINEDTELAATDPYGQSKVQAEHIVSKWCAQNNVICTILRLPLIAGANPPGNLGAMINGIKKGFYFNIAGGKTKKSVVLADSVAAIIPQAATIGGIYNLTDGYHPSFAELAALIATQLNKGKPANIPGFVAKTMARFGDLLGKRAPLNSDKLKKITSDLTFDDTKARASIGWNPEPVLKGFKIG